MNTKPRDGKGTDGKVRYSQGTGATLQVLTGTDSMKMPDPEYRALQAVNYSSLKKIADSPLHYWHEVLNPEREKKEPTPAMVLGSAIHCLCLEGLETFAKQYIRAGKFDRRTKEGKANYEAYLEAKGDATELSWELWDQTHAVAAAVLKSPMAQALIEGANGHSEEVVQWFDKETGMLCKCKADRIQTIDHETYVVDLKTTRDASPQSFARDMANLRYHWQAAFYSDGVAASGDWGPVKGFIFIAVEKEPPYPVAIYNVPESTLQHGRDQYRAALHKLKECLEADYWPGYDDKIRDLELPRWALAS